MMAAALAVVDGHCGVGGDGSRDGNGEQWIEEKTIDLYKGYFSLCDYLSPFH
ncbi:hypothetical protein Syun_018398 [Stephania yunnanensis]|uniref:Uncharacterized protein n=1 Tax=Stephania yunnanensis TaxID=152371 RepID=A0AAP0IUG8_9MAGN